MIESRDPEFFVGQGDEAYVYGKTGRMLEEWQRHEDSTSSRQSTSHDHPRGYIAHDDVAAAVNTALLLGKPLLLAGNPGTGKSQLADRIAWEFNLSPVLRFEAQSISEAQDLFYRFDLVGQLARVQLEKARQPVGAIDPDARQSSSGTADWIDFITFGPLGKAILRAAQPLDDQQQLYRNLLAHAFPKEAPSAELRARRSIVLIDEIDKASRDFPNDLLNAIERLEFRIRELREFAWSPIRVCEDDAYRPIVIITSNGEREIPAPFLRRCVFCHIPDPDPQLLRRIVRNRVLGAPPSGRLETGQVSAALLPKLYEDLLGVFLEFRGDAQSFAYRPGTSELVDWSRAIHRRRADPESHLRHGRNHAIVRETASAVAKNDKDRSRLIQLLPLVPDTNEPSS